MVKLSEIHNAIGNYLYMYGDKDVTSIATWNGTAPVQYTFNLHDIYEEKIGHNPYSGSDKIDIPRDRRR